jgi:hypothetical protein
MAILAANSSRPLCDCQPSAATGSALLHSRANSAACVEQLNTLPRSLNHPELTAHGHAHPLKPQAAAAAAYLS